MANKLEGEALDDFLTTGTRTAKIAVVKKDGSPSVSPVWFIMDAGDLLFTTMATSLKCRAMLREPRVSVCVDEELYPYGFAVLRGRASIERLAVEQLLPWATRIAARYVPGDLAQQFGERNAVEGEVLVRVRPESAFAFSGVTD